MREGHYVLTEHPETKVGEYVPFYFCPRSIMLYILHKGNHPELDYEGGQRPIVHLQADLEQTIHWAEERKVRWAITDRNAGGYLADFYNHPDDIDKVEWEAVRATDFRGITVKEGDLPPSMCPHPELGYGCGERFGDRFRCRWAIAQ